jgi:hypothetical protein
MKRLDAALRKIKKGMDASFTVTQNGRTFINYTCSQGKMVTVDYFALKALIEFYEETRDKANRIMIARDMLRGVYFSSEPIDKGKTITTVNE